MKNVKNRIIGEKLVQKKSLGRAKSDRDLSFEVMWIFAIHKWMLIADFSSWIMVAILKKAQEKLGTGRIEKLLNKLRRPQAILR